MSKNLSDDLKNRLNVGLNYKNQGDYKTAYLIFSQLSKHYTDSPSVFGLLGEACWNLEILTGHFLRWRDFCQ
jgi:hypothetical protein